MIAGGKPFSDIAATFLDLADGQADPLGRGRVGRKRTPGRDRFADGGASEPSLGECFPTTAVQVFLGVGRLNALADCRVEGKEQEHLCHARRQAGAMKAYFQGRFSSKASRCFSA